MNVAPVRCFFRDIPQAIVSHHPGKAKNNDTATTIHSRSHHGTLHDDDDDDAVDPLMLRLMGTVTSVEEECAHIALDDGTAIVSMQATPTMITKLSVVPGMLLEAIVRVQQQADVAVAPTSDTSSIHDDSDDESNMALLVQQLVAVQDKNAETLRWLELSYRKDNDDDDPYTTRWGYPCRRTSADDIYGIVVSNAEAGVLPSDLAECLNLGMAEIQGLVQELQMSGQVYLNKDGACLPL